MSTPDPIVALENALTFFAAPNEQSNSWRSPPATATPTAILQVAQTLIGLLASAGTVGSSVTEVTSAFAAALTDAADILNSIGDDIAGGQIANAVTTLETNISSIQTQAPGGSVVFSLNSLGGTGGQFFTALQTYLKTFTGDVNALEMNIYKIAQQFRAVAAVVGYSGAE